MTQNLAPTLSSSAWMRCFRSGYRRQTEKLLDAFEKPPFETTFQTRSYHKVSSDSQGHHRKATPSTRIFNI